MSALPSAGDLASHPLPRLLLELRRERFAGSLALERERVAKRIVFQEGVPVFAESNLPSETLGLQLLDEGAITRDDHARVSQRVQEKGCKEGAALLELGLLRPPDLFRALKDQMRRRILECFGWAGGSFHLEQTDALPSGVQAFRTDPFPLVLDGLRRHWPPDRLLASLAPKLDQHPVPQKGFARVRDRLAGDDEAIRLLDALDGSRTLGAALEQAFGPGALAAAWLVDAAGAVRWSDTPSTPRSAEPADPAEIELVFDTGQAPSAPARVEKRPETARPAASAASSEALRREVLERHARLAELDHYAVLGVRRDADADAIKRAYFRAAKRYHPDAVAGLGLSDVREAATALFARVARAYAVLCDQGSRRDYDAELDGDVSADVDRLANAEALYRKGQVLLRAGDFGGALPFLQPAVQLWGEEAAYRSALGWALFKKTPPDATAAREHLERAIALAPKDATALFRLGVVLREIGETQNAEKHLASARKIDPKVTGR